MNSYSLKSILSELQINRKNLIKLANSLKMKLGNDYQVNIFDWIDQESYKSYTFVGFEHRRKDYERDKLFGTNVVENNINNGIYS
jgi:hypothetical protein